MGNWRQHWFVGLAGAIGVAIAAPHPSVAQSLIVEDDTLGTERSRVIPNFNGLPVEVITDGVQRGPNLFHSFVEFNVSAGRGAYFFSPNAVVQTILARITGANRSDILGTLGTFGNSRPDLVLINPNGILFGPNAALDVGGSLMATTASGVQFSDRGAFGATNPAPPTALLTVNPSAFFFTAMTPGAIINRSRATTNVLGTATTGLRVPDGQNLVLLGGNVTVADGWLNARSGQIEIGAVAGVGTVGLSPGGQLNLPADLPRATVDLQAAWVGVLSELGGGRIGISAQDIRIRDGSLLLTGIVPGGGSPTSQSGRVTLNATNQIQIESDSLIFSDVGNNAVGQAGDIEISTGSLALLGDSGLISRTSGTGNAGNVIIQARDRVVLSGDYTTIDSGIRRTGRGKGGDIRITTGQLELFDGSQLVTATLGIGDAGDVVVNARDRVTLVGGNRTTASDTGIFSSVGSRANPLAQGQGGNIVITTPTFELLNNAQMSSGTYGRGDAGRVMIEARDLVVLRGEDTIISSRVEQTGQGQGGELRIVTGTLEVTDGATLNSSTLGSGKAGTMLMSGRDRVLFNRGNAFSAARGDNRSPGGDIQIETPMLDLTNGSEIGSFTFRDAQAGNITVWADHMTITRGAGLSSAALIGRGDAGTIRLAIRDRLQLDNGRISSGVAVTSSGAGGNIEVTTTQLEATNLSVLDSSTDGGGNAGQIQIQARDRMVWDDSAILSNVGLTGRGNGGDIRLLAHTLDILNGTIVVAATDGLGNAGTIDIKTTQATTVAGSSAQLGSPSGLFTSTTTSGQGGAIGVQTPIFRVTDGAVLDSRTFRSGTSGDIRVTAAVVDIVNGGQIVATTQGSGSAGSIAITATEELTLAGRDATFTERVQKNPAFSSLYTPNSSIVVRSAASGRTGDITLRAPTIRLDQGLINAESTTVDGGNIALTAPRLLLLRNGSLISATAGTAQTGGDGGNIAINARFIVALPEENSDITANAFNGRGGTIQITTNGIFGLQFRPQRTPLSDITASSQFGLSGTVAILSPDTSFIQNSLTDITPALIDTSQLVATSCVVRSRQQTGRFVISGADQLPIRPGDVQLSTYPTGGVRSVEGERVGGAGAIAEPQGVYRLEDGRLVMSRECR